MFARKVIRIGVGLGLSLCAACTPSAPSATEPPTVDAAATAREEAVGTAVAATAAFEEAQAARTATQAADETQEAGATATLVARKTESAAEYQVTRNAAKTQIVLEATATAQPFAARIQQLVTDGYLTTAEGTFSELPDFYESWAQINWYQWIYTDASPTDFVVRTDIDWSSASDKANWFNSGCGFVFRASGDEDAGYSHYLTYLGLDGVVYFSRLRKGNYTDLTSDSYGKVSVPNGSASMMLVVEGSKFTMFINDQRVVSAVDSTLTSGELNYTLLSGTNRDYGTRCHMKNVELWTIR